MTDIPGYLIRTEDLVEDLPPLGSAGTAHSAGNGALLSQVQYLGYGEESMTESIYRTCIPSVKAHHSLTFGFACMRSMSPLKSVPRYLKVAKRV